MDCNLENNGKGILRNKTTGVAEIMYNDMRAEVPHIEVQQNLRMGLWDTWLFCRVDFNMEKVWLKIVTSGQILVKIAQICFKILSLTLLALIY
jgi:hypothetical protein